MNQRHKKRIVGAESYMDQLSNTSSLLISTRLYIFSFVSKSTFLLLCLHRYDGTLRMTGKHAVQVSASCGTVKIPDPTDNIETFIFCPSPQGTVMRCRVTRDKKGVDRNMYPTYYLHMERGDGKKVCFVVN